jgi:hypothetical protein
MSVVKWLVLYYGTGVCKSYECSEVISVVLRY